MLGGNKFYEDEETGEDMIEDEVFRKRRFVPSKMDSLGFQKSGDQYCYETDFINGEFHVILSVEMQSAGKFCLLQSRQTESRK